VFYLVACLLDRGESRLQVLFFKFKGSKRFKANSAKVSINSKALADLDPPFETRLRLSSRLSQQHSEI
jgi:hypothetical protein